MISGASAPRSEPAAGEEPGRSARSAALFVTGRSGPGIKFCRRDVRRRDVAANGGFVKLDTFAQVLDADSDEAAPLFRDYSAPGFRDDLARWGWGSAGVIVVISFACGVKLCWAVFDASFRL
ncbi:hypothetical protein ACG873_32225 [Mesorhizobium sp. AaZ16]|uniref:hypothetical protein n=1 Tax=Mesorhizobium sp. AaZ16 TaxID=3402289 RepID=UPI00374E2B4B